MALENFLASRVPLYMTAGTKTITLKVSSTEAVWGTVTPRTIANGTPGIITGISPQLFSGSNGVAQSVAAFGQWWEANPFVVKKLNIRCTKALDLPTQIIFKTNDIFSGNIQNQIVDVSAAFQSTQFQNSIVTIPNLEILVGRNTSIEIAGTPTGSSESPAVMFIDVTIGYFISLEFALQQAHLSNAVSTEDATTVVSAVDNEGTKIASVDLNEETMKVSPDIRAKLLQAIKAKQATGGFQITPGSYKVNL